MVHLATRTLMSIDANLDKDAGAQYRVWLGKVIPHIADAYRGDSDPFRTHLGASLIGQKCGLKLWYGFRWFKRSKFPARIHRLFNRGHLEEARFIALLLQAGMQVYQQDDKGNQYRLSEFGGHFGSAIDGIVLNCPDVSAGTYVLTEFKTHGEKSFNKLVKDGVKSSKPEHYVQMCIYMRKMNLPVALYLAVNKNNDDLYAELIARDDAVAMQFIDRAESIIFTEVVPERYADTPANFVCKMCEYRDICYNQDTFEENCRTCAYSKPERDGTWSCAKNKITLTKEMQYNGCNDYCKINLRG